MSRTIVVGDLHGCYDELMEMLETAGFGQDDRVVCVGDLVTKGPKNREVLDLFMTDSRFRTVIGNHDLALRRKWHGEKVKLKASQKATHKELKSDKEKYLPFLNTLPFTIDLGTHLVVHAGLRPNVALYSQTSEDMTLLRTLGKNRESHDGTPWYEVYDGDKVVLFGHWPAPEPRRGPRAIGLDTGCVYGYNLTAYIIEEDKIITTRARQVYEDREG
jgi:serine/threonine protein phosphatase 1